LSIGKIAAIAAHLLRDGRRKAGREAGREHGWCIRCIAGRIGFGRQLFPANLPATPPAGN
jgi:hypothetical protein